MFTIILAIIALANSQCSERSVEYHNWNGNNIVNVYFVPETIANLTLKIINNNTEFIQDLENSSIICTGQWCINSYQSPLWSCDIVNRCYEMMHIIPPFNSINELSGCKISDYNVRSNLVMAYGMWRWSVDFNVGNIKNKRDVYSLIGERQAVFGDTIMQNAYISVYRKCKYLPPLDFPDKLCLNQIGKSNEVQSIIIVGSIVISVLFVVIAVVVIIRWRIMFSSCYNYLRKKEYNEIMV